MVIQGATPEQESLLREILGRVGTVAITSATIAPKDLLDNGEAHRSGRYPAPEAPVDHVQVGLAYDLADRWTAWIARLVADAFSEQSERRDLPHVVWFSTPGGGGALRVGNVPARPALEPLVAREVEQLERDIDQAVRRAEAEMTRFELVRPYAHAAGVCLRVDDPHAFLRLRFIPFLRAAFGAWTQRLAGTFVEIRDSTGGFVAFRACHLSSRWSGCTSGNHDDYECCAPFFGFSRGIDYDGPPPCPVFDRSAN